MIWSGGFLCRLLGLLLKPGLPLVENVIKLLAKSALPSLGIKCQYQQYMQEYIQKFKLLLSFGFCFAYKNTKMKWWNGRHYENSLISWRYG